MLKTLPPKGEGFLTWVDGNDKEMIITAVDQDDQYVEMAAVTMLTPNEN